MKSFNRSAKTGKNLPGFLLSLCAAFGGLFLVQRQLALETENLLSSGGQTPIPNHSQETVSSAESPEATFFTQEDQLLQFTEDLGNQSEAVPHDPLPGQLSMAEAVESVKVWLEDFFMPGLSATDFRLSEYKTDCYLWTAQKEETEEQNPLYSYWNITLRSRELEAVLILNALTGQVLDAFVVCSPPAGYHTEENLPALLAGYADSLRPDDSYSFFFSGDLVLEITEKPSGEADGTSSEQAPGNSSAEANGISSGQAPGNSSDKTDGTPSDQAPGNSSTETDGTPFHRKGSEPAPKSNGDSLEDNAASLPDESGTVLYQSLGSQGLYAAVSTGSVVVSSPDTPEYTEFLSIHLYLTYEAETP